MNAFRNRSLFESVPWNHARIVNSRYRNLSILITLPSVQDPVTSGTRSVCFWAIRLVVIRSDLITRKRRGKISPIVRKYSRLHINSIAWNEDSFLRRLIHFEISYLFLGFAKKEAVKVYFETRFYCSVTFTYLHIYIRRKGLWLV